MKNAYYRADGNLETLPNIDINIKCGNSLISRFGLDVDVKQVLQKQKFSIEQYRNAVQTYRSAESKTQKREMEGLIAKIKNGFSVYLGDYTPDKKKLLKLQQELAEKEHPLLFESENDKKAREKKIAKLHNEIDKLEAKIADIESGRLYENALEWRFEFPEVLNDQGDFVGFDVIIGNPPYIRQEEIKELKPSLQQNYQCYTGVADLFVYFYELSLNLLKAKGHLTYISSNKYFRANYGEKLRQLLADSTTIYNLIDFGDYPVFEEAIAYPSIITLSKDKSENNQVQALSWDETKKQDISQFATVLEQDVLIISQENLKPDGWRLESFQILDLLTKLRNSGIPLGEYVNGKFYRGILTGFNEAFIIDQATRDKLIAEHSSSAEVIKSLLRGRDVKRWQIEYQNLWLIFTRRGIDIKKYPAIEKYLSQYKEQLTPGIGRKAGTYKWYEIQDNVAYWQEFEQPKITWGNLATSPQFTIDLMNSFVCAPANLIVSENNKYLLAILNSGITQYIVSQNAAIRQGGFFEFKPMYVSQIPIPVISELEKKEIESLVQKCLDAKKSDPKADTTALEKAIDQLVYQLYGLTEEEIKIVEGGK